MWNAEEKQKLFIFSLAGRLVDTLLSQESHGFQVFCELPSSAGSRDNGWQHSMVPVRPDFLMSAVVVLDLHFSPDPSNGSTNTYFSVLSFFLLKISIRVSVFTMQPQRISNPASAMSGKWGWGVVLHRWLWLVYMLLGKSREGLQRRKTVFPLSFPIFFTSFFRISLDA